jgi:hypothetical protein
MNYENRTIMQEAQLEELQTKVNKLTTENAQLRKSLLEVLGLALEYAPKEMVELIMNGMIGGPLLAEK